MAKRTIIWVYFQEQGKLEQAIDAYSKALSINPENAEAYYNLGNVFRDQGKLDEAKEAFNKAIHANPSLAIGYNNLEFFFKTKVI